MTEQNSRSEQVESTFNQAAESYRTGPAESWEIAAQGTLSAAQLRPGQLVLDVCCGAGTTALPAAEVVAPDGTVIGVDLSEAMITLARAEQAERRLTNLEFAVADMTKLSYGPESFDVVICQLGIFFVEDPLAQTRLLWSFVKPGGRLVLTTLYKGDETQLSRVWLDAVNAEDPELLPPQSSSRSPQARTRDVEPLQQLMLEAGTSDPTITVAKYQIPVESPEDYWQMRTGSGARGTLERLGSEAAARVREKVIGFMEQNRVSAWEWNVIHAVAEN